MSTCTQGWDHHVGLFPLFVAHNTLERNIKFSCCVISGQHPKQADCSTPDVQEIHLTSPLQATRQCSMNRRYIKTKGLQVADHNGLSTGMIVNLNVQTSQLLRGDMRGQHPSGSGNIRAYMRLYKMATWQYCPKQRHNG
jgi:hypothetical protein